MDAKQYIYLFIYLLAGTLLGWNILLTTKYRYWLRSISSTFCRRLKLVFFHCRNTPTNKNEVALLKLIFFSYYYADEGNITFWASYSFTGPIFYTVSLLDCEKVKSEIWRVDRSKRLIKVWSLLHSIT
jgi:hypothetical protein